MPSSHPSTPNPRHGLDSRTTVSKIVFHFFLRSQASPISCLPQLSPFPLRDPRTHVSRLPGCRGSVSRRKRPTELSRQAKQCVLLYVAATIGSRGSAGTEGTQFGTRPRPASVQPARQPHSPYGQPRLRSQSSYHPTYPCLPRPLIGQTQGASLDPAPIRSCLRVLGPPRPPAGSQPIRRQSRWGRGAAETPGLGQ